MMNQLLFTFVQYPAYKLTVIEDEEVPLALNLSMKYYGPVIISLVLLIALLCAIVYATLCEKQRRRILQLDTDGTAYRGWRINRLKDTVLELEALKVTEMNLEFSDQEDMLFELSM